MTQNIHIFLISLAFLLSSTFCIEADSKDYPKVLNYAIDQANQAAANNDLAIGFFKVLYFSISDTQNGKQYHMTLNYLTTDGYQHFYDITVYENPWGELSLMDLEHHSRLLTEIQAFLP